MKKLTKLTALLFATLLLASSAAGCSSGTSSSSQQNASTASAGGGSGSSSAVEKPYEVSLINNYYNTEAPADAAFVKAIEEYTNTKLDITWVPAAAYDEKLNALVAANDLPKLVMSRQNKNSQMVSAARAGMFWEIGPMLKDYPNLDKMNKDVQKNVSIDAKDFGVFRERWVARAGYIIRKDWLDKLGMAMPKTVDELYSVIEAFSTKDPDGNGKNDTFGLAAYMDNSYSYVTSVCTWIGGPNGWYVKDDKVMPIFDNENYIKTLDLFKKMYDNGYMNKDFPVLNQQQMRDNILQGKAGISLQVIDDAREKYEDLYKLFPDAKIDVGQVFTTPDSKEVVQGGSGYNGVYYMPKTTVKTEEDARKLLGFLDKFGDDKMLDMLYYGREGEHYTLQDGKVARTAEQSSLYSTKIGDYKQLTPFAMSYKTPIANATEIFVKTEEMAVGNAKYAVMDASSPLISETFVKSGTEMNKIWMDASTKYILGDLDLAGLQAAFEQWRQTGGNKMIEEYTAQYALTK